MHLKNDPLRSSILMSGNTKHLAKKCVKDAGPCLVLCAAGVAVALLAVLGPFDVLRSASSLHVSFRWKRKRTEASVPDPES